MSYTLVYEFYGMYEGRREVQEDAVFFLSMPSSVDATVYSEILFG